VIGKHFSLFYTKESQKRKHPQRELEIARAKGSYEEEGWRVRKDGSLIWANVVITAVYEADKLIGFAKVTRDLTQRLLTDQEREMSAKTLDATNIDLQRALDVKSRFLSTISHEVRTPMTAIIGMTELLTTEDLGKDNNVVVRNIFDASQRLLQLLNNLLEAARMESGELILENRKFPIRAVIGDIRQLIAVEASRKQLRITGNVDPEIPEYILGDELKLRQVLLNLSHNAVKFTDAGTIDISAELVSKTRNSFTIRFVITDTGIGIKSGDKEKLFKPFVQAEDSTKRVYGGTGLGLSISKQLVELMGGTFGLETKFGEGSKFWFNIAFSEEGVA
jgi:signal transduction histidine kinase